MRLSRAKVNHLSRLVVEAIVADDRVVVSSDPNEVRLEIVRILTDEVERDDMVDDLVRTKITSQKRLNKVPTGASVRRKRSLP